MIWITEEYDSQVEELTTEIRRQGHDVMPVHYYKMQEDNSLPMSHDRIPKDACVLYYGSIQTGLWIQRNKPWVPGCWYNTPLYKCSYYYGYMGQHLFNDRYMMIPFMEIERRKHELFVTFGEGKTGEQGIFVRPDSNNKTFTGQVFHEDTWASDWRKAAYNCEPETLCVVAKPKMILGEWRFFVSQGIVITGSQYRKDGSSEVEEGYPDGALKFAEDVVCSIPYNPDPMWSIDIAQDAEGNFRVMEVGSFCTAGLYASDLKILVEHASIQAQAEHTSIFDPDCPL